MTIKTTGAEFVRFYNDPAVWANPVNPDNGAWWDDTEIIVDGKGWDDAKDYSEIPAESSVNFTGGCFFKTQDANEADDLEAVFRKWRKGLNTVSFVVECARDKEAAVHEAIKAAGGKVAK